MFQTEFNHFFQSFASDELTLFMRFVTALGYQEFFLLFLLILLLAVDFKKAFILFMVLLWTAAITFFLKDYFDLPRPFHVDNTLELLDGKLPDGATFEFSNRGAKSFWEVLPADVVKATRQSEDVKNGFPSGHSSIAIAFWGALALLYRKRWISLISILLMVLIPISRIYLGVHFLADVISGVTLGALILGAFYLIILKPNKLSSFLKTEKYTIGVNPLSLTLLLSPFLFFLLLPEEVYILIAYMLGFGLGFLLLARKGLPNDQASFFHRLGRMIVGALAFLVVGFIFKQIGLEEHIWISFIKNLVAALALIWIGTEISIRLGFFKRKNKEVV